MAYHNDIGKLGEDIACDFLIGKGLIIVSRNFRKPYGEIDIVARETPSWFGNTGRKYRFVEVKSVSYLSAGTPARASAQVGETDQSANQGVPYETPDSKRGSYRPEDNMHPQKVKRLMRVIESYILSKNIEDEWQFDVLAVFIDSKTKIAKVRHLEDIILGT